MKLTTKKWPKKIVPRITDRAYADMRRLMERKASSAQIISLLRQSRVCEGKYDRRIIKQAEKNNLPPTVRYYNIPTLLVFQTIGKTIVAVYSRDYKRHKPKRFKKT